MNYKRIVGYTLIIILGILILNLLAANQSNMQAAADRLHTHRLTRLHLIRAVYGLILGLLVKWQVIIKLIQGNFERNLMNLKLFSGVLLFLISLFPPMAFSQQFGLSTPFPLSQIGIHIIWAPFQYGTTQLIISIISGVLIAEGLYRPKKTVA